MMNNIDIRKAKEAYLFNGDTLYIVDQNDEAYWYCVQEDKWYLKESFWDYFDSEMMMSYLKVLTIDEALAIYNEWVMR